MWIRSVARVDHSWLVADVMAVVGSVASSKVVLTRAWEFERGSGVKTTMRSGTMCNSRGRKREVEKVGSLVISSLVVGDWVDGHPEHSLRRAALGGLPLQQVLGGIPAGG